jgi:hypothetical protein
VVVVGDDVIDERREGSQLPPRGGLGYGLLAANLVEDGVGVETALAAGVRERAAPAAAEIELVGIEDARRRGMSDSQVS